MRATAVNISFCLVSLCIGCGRVGYDPIQLQDVGPAGGGSAPASMGLDASVLAGGGGRASSNAGSSSAGSASTMSGDAGTALPQSDASPAVAGVDCAGTVLCDAFDTDLSKWTEDYINGSVVLDTTLKVAGTSSAHFTTDGRNDKARLIGNLAAPLTSGNLFVRFYLYVPSTVTVRDYVVVFEWQKEVGKFSFDFVHDLFQLNLNPDDIITQGDIPKDRWFCVLLETVVSDQGSVSLSVDGQPVSMVVGDTLPNAGIERFFLSVLNSPTQNSPMEFHVDEFIATTEPLACP